jgi:hypothetical protein
MRCLIRQGPDPAGPLARCPSAARGELTKPVDGDEAQSTAVEPLYDAGEGGDGLGTVATRVVHEHDRPGRGRCGHRRDDGVRSRGGCRFSKELSSRTAVTWADVRCLIVLSGGLSQRSVIFFRNRPRAAGEGSFVRVPAVRWRWQLSPRSIRRSMATLALNEGVPLHEVQDYLGHATPAPPAATTSAATGSSAPRIPAARDADGRHASRSPR